MSLFKVSKNKKIEKINRISFSLEKDIQNITENNLDLIFNLEFVKSEFQLNDLRIDTLAFDNENRSFVIIEYKKNSNFSVIDQGYSYLSLLLNKKADFVLEYSNIKNELIKKNDIDWSQSKVIFIAPNFTKYQQKSIGFKDLPIELWEISKYENDLILFNELKESENSASIKTISSDDEKISKVNKEIKVYNEEDHFKGKNEIVLELYEELKERILDLDENISIEPKKKYIAFKKESNIVDIEIQKNMIKIWLNMNIGELEDPKSKARDVSKTGHHGNGDYEIKINKSVDLDYIMFLIKQTL